MDNNTTDDQLSTFFKNFGAPNQNLMTWLDRVHIATLTVSNIFNGMVKEIDGTDDADSLDPDDQKMLDDITDEQKEMMQALKGSDEFADLFGDDGDADDHNHDDDEDFPELFMNALSFACYDFVSLGASDDAASLAAIQAVNGNLFGMEGSAAEITEDIDAYNNANMPRFYIVLTNLLNEVATVAKDMPWVKYTDKASNAGIDFMEMYTNLAALYFTYKQEFDADLEAGYRDMLAKVMANIQLPANQAFTDAQKQEIINGSVQTIKAALA